MSKGKCEPIPEMVGKHIRIQGEQLKQCSETNLQPYIYNTKNKRKINELHPTQKFKNYSVNLKVAINKAKSETELENRKTK